MSDERLNKHEIEIQVNKDRLEKLERRIETIASIKQDLFPLHKGKEDKPLMEIISEVEEKENLHYHCFREMSKWLLKIGRQQKKLEQKQKQYEEMYNSNVESFLKQVQEKLDPFKERQDTLSAVIREIICIESLEESIDMKQLDGEPSGLIPDKEYDEFKIDDTNISDDLYNKEEQEAPFPQPPISRYTSILEDVKVGEAEPRKVDLPTLWRAEQLKHQKLTLIAEFLEDLRSANSRKELIDKWEGRRKE